MYSPRLSRPSLILSLLLALDLALSLVLAIALAISPSLVLVLVLAQALASIGEPCMIPGLSMAVPLSCVYSGLMKLTVESMLLYAAQG